VPKDDFVDISSYNRFVRLKEEVFELIFSEIAIDLF